MMWLDVVYYTALALVVFVVVDWNFGWLARTNIRCLGLLFHRFIRVRENWNGAFTLYRCEKCGVETWDL